MSEESRLQWSGLKVLIVLVLFGASGALFFLGLRPFLTAQADKKSIANIGFMVLIAIFIFGFIKVRKESRFAFWAGCFSLILYTNAMFMFYQDLFEE